MKKVLKYLIPFLICSIFTVVILATRGSFVKTGKTLMGELSDAFFVPGVITLGIGLLVMATNGGAFDMLSFGVLKLFDLLKRDLTKVKYRTFYDYRQAQKEKKRSFLHVVLIGAGFVLVALVFLVIYLYS